MVAAIIGVADLTALGHKKGLYLQPKHVLNFIVFVTTPVEKVGVRIARKYTGVALCH